MSRKIIIASDPWDYIFYKKNNKYYLSVMSGGVAQYEIDFPLTVDEVNDYSERGLDSVLELVEKVRNNNGIYFQRAKESKT